MNFYGNRSKIYYRHVFIYLLTVHTDFVETVLNFLHFVELSVPFDLRHFQNSSKNNGDIIEKTETDNPYFNYIFLLKNIYILSLSFVRILNK